MNDPAFARAKHERLENPAAATAVRASWSGDSVPAILRTQALHDGDHVMTHMQQATRTSAALSRRRVGALLIAILAALPCRLASPAPAAETTAGVGSSRVIDVHVAANGAAVRPRTFRVLDGESVRLEVTADVPSTVHLHGYDRELRVVPPQRASMQFQATTTGRFPLVTHAEPSHRDSVARERVLLYLEVYPR